MLRLFPHHVASLARLSYMLVWFLSAPFVPCAAKRPCGELRTFACPNLSSSARFGTSSLRLMRFWFPPVGRRETIPLLPLRLRRQLLLRAAFVLGLHERRLQSANNTPAVPSLMPTGYPLFPLVSCLRDPLCAHEALAPSLPRRAPRAPNISLFVFTACDATRLAALLPSRRSFAAQLPPRSTTPAFTVCAQSASWLRAEDGLRHCALCGLEPSAARDRRLLSRSAHPPRTMRNAGPAVPASRQGAFVYRRTKIKQTASGCTPFFCSPHSRRSPPC
ncbi:hypothetical protein TRVL_03013 [Trypanosoma vivax]|nr:hypothetical protein TRVL_03013 [Trypanosoma vivax]